MRILFVNDKRGYFGGVEQCIADSSRGLAARGHSCHLAYRSRTGRGEPAFDRGFESIQSCARPGETDEQPVALDKLVARLRPDLVYVHKVEAIGPVLDAAGHAPVVRMVHDHDLTCPRRHKYDSYTGRTCQRAASWGCLADLAFVERSPTSPLGVAFVNVAQRLRELARHRAGLRLVVASRYMRSELVRNGCDPTRIRVLAPCVDVPAASWSPPTREPRLLYIGQLVRGKGVDLLLHAISRLAPSYQLDVVGAGNARGGLVELARRLGIDRRVTFHGWMDPAKTAVTFERARMVVVPSRWPEPFGMVGVEAMAHARAVVAFDVGGISDWLAHGGTGLLVPEQDVTRLASAIDLVHRLPGLAEDMGAAGRRRYEREYRYGQLVRRLELELEHALAEVHADVCGPRVEEEASR